MNFNQFMGSAAPIAGTGIGALFGGPAGAAIGGSIGGVVGGAFTNAQNSEEAQKNREWQERMSSTAHQREAADLEAAGLNRILSANSSGASTPSGATAQMDQVGEKVGSTAMDIALMKQAKVKQDAEIGLMASQGKMADATAAKAKMDTIVASKELPKADVINKAYKAANDIVGKIMEGGSSAPKQLSEKGIKLRNAIEIKDEKQLRKLMPVPGLEYYGVKP